MQNNFRGKLRASTSYSKLDFLSVTEVHLPSRINRHDWPVELFALRAQCGRDARGPSIKLSVVRNSLAVPDW